MSKRISLLLIIVLLVISGCSNLKSSFRECSYSLINYADVLLLDDITYAYISDVVEEQHKGKKIGEVKNTVDGYACSDYKMVNGDAPYLPIGTEIYEYTGYKSDFRVIAHNKIYQVHRNDNAKTIGELYDIKGKVEEVSLLSSEDGRHLLDFTPQETEEFVNMFLSLEYVGFDEIYESIKHSYVSSLRIQLNDGTFVGANYWDKGNAINPGAFATEELKIFMETIIARKNEFIQTEPKEETKVKR